MMVLIWKPFWQSSCLSLLSAEIKYVSPGPALFDDNDDTTTRRERQTGRQADRQTDRDTYTEYTLLRSLMIAGISAQPTCVISVHWLGSFLSGPLFNLQLLLFWAPLGTRDQDLWVLLVLVPPAECCTPTTQGAQGCKSSIRRQMPACGLFPSPSDLLCRKNLFLKVARRRHFLRDADLRLLSHGR